MFCLKLLIETTAGKNATDLVFDSRGSVTHIMAALDASNVSYMSIVSGVEVAQSDSHRLLFPPRQLLLCESTSEFLAGGQLHPYSPGLFESPNL